MTYTPQQDRRSIVRDEDMWNDHNLAISEAIFEGRWCMVYTFRTKDWLEHNPAQPWKAGWAA